MKRFLFSSSCSLYGAGGNGFLDETVAFKSKVRVEQEVSKLADDKFAPVYLRNATTYGVSRRLRAGIVVNNLVVTLSRRGAPPKRRQSLAAARSSTSATSSTPSTAA